MVEVRTAQAMFTIVDGKFEFCLKPIPVEQNRHSLREISYTAAGFDQLAGILKDAVQNGQEKTLPEIG